MAEHPGHCVALVGGAVSGAEAAYQLSQRGIHIVLFEQNALPYGKIEDGLPKWHIKLRDKEERKIDRKLHNEYVHYVPCVKIGKDIDFRDLVNNWGFTAVLLATGAWRDRPLPIEGIEAYVHCGLYYQNPFFYWYNHKHEPAYKGPEIKIRDGAIIIGGGLASIDVAKAVMMETVEKALAGRGIKTHVFELERKGIDQVLRAHHLTLHELGLKGCTLYYRRREKDMPLTTANTDTPESLAKAENTRVKILKKAMQKFCFKFVGCSMPVDKIIQDERLGGIVFRKTKIENGKVIPIEGSDFKVRTDLVISSIGSIPEKIPGIPTKGQIFDLEDEKTCRIRGFDNVFALGNAVTGRGNIKESYQHGQDMSRHMMDSYLDWQEQDFHDLLRGKESVITPSAEAVAEVVLEKHLQPYAVIHEMKVGVTKFWERAGYDGDYLKWIEKNLPPRLEDLLGISH